ncbi:inositol monophosphatase [Staphylococcus gallinarum]|uniref:Inositol monophosphatase n=1 Tax=Staphylococcus gallinarum TaxID=1293 RepID=A0A380FMH8_STAGA|nr:inositol monophosphatase [Staphylococcus gallinarum]
MVQYVNGAPLEKPESIELKDAVVSFNALVINANKMQELLTLPLVIVLLAHVV